jgi:predicted AlkP superfamily phosphohydrolase/phosphomutase
MFAPKSKLERVARKIARRLQGPPKADGPPLDWMPATQYQPHWRRMRAFALPSFYDGRIRINLKGREREGLVDLNEYDAECDRIVALLQECRDPVTDGPVVDSVEKRRGDPLSAAESEADLIVAWTMAPHYGLKHPSTGVIGPLPYRRTGGHTGPHGFAYFKGPGITPGDFGTRSAFDVVPTVLEMLDAGWPSTVSGESVAPALITQS